MSRTQDALTYRAPRTQQEAFGPYTDHSLHAAPSDPMAWQERLILWVCVATVIVVSLMACAGWLK